MQGVNTSKNTLLFLHGMGGTGAIWRPIAAQLEETYACLAPDQRGHGESRPIPANEAGQFHAMDYALDVEKLIEAEVSGPLTIIGHSMGVRTGLALTSLYAKKDASKVKGLIAVDIGITSQWGGGIGQPLSDFISKLPLSFSSRSLMRDYLFTHCPDPAIAQYLSAVAKNQATVSGEAESWIFPFDHESLVQTIEQANQARIPEWLLETANAGIKVLFLRGANSRVWQKADYESQKLEFAHPLIQFEEWENCGHGLPFEQRARFVERIKEFTSYSPEP